MRPIEFMSLMSPVVGASLALSVFFLFILLLFMIIKVAKGRSAFGRRIKWCAFFVFSLLLISLATVRFMHYLLFASAEKILTSPNLVVFADGRIVEEKHNFSDDFLNRSTLKRSGSEPERGVEVLLSDGNYELKFIFKSDSRNKHLYWVYFPGYRYFSSAAFVETQTLSSGMVGEVYQ